MAPEMITEDTPGAASIPTVESAPADVEKMIASALETWEYGRAVSEVVASIAKGIADDLAAGGQPHESRLARYRYARALDTERASRELAEHTAPALEAIQQASQPIPGRMGTGNVLGDDEESLDFADESGELDDPFRGIPNAGDEENRPL